MTQASEFTQGYLTNIVKSVHPLWAGRKSGSVTTQTFMQERGWQWKTSFPTLVDQIPTYERSERNELVKRLLADKCEMCGSREQIPVHHIRKLADREKKGQERPRWVKIMAARRRKTLVVCYLCHQTWI
jgi:hypothetical protein